MSFVDELWNGRPNVPRAVAALLAFSECDAQVREMIDSGQADLGVATLTDSCSARREWAHEYRMPWREANAVLDAMMHHAVLHPVAVRGEEVLQEVPVRLLEWLGYVDGLAGHRAPPEPDKMLFSSSHTVRRPPENNNNMEGVRWRVERLLGRAYERGYTFGRASAALASPARRLCNEATQACSQERLSVRVWKERIDGVAVLAGGDEEAQIQPYATGLWRVLRLVAARRRTAEAITRSPVPVLGLAWRIRECALREAGSTQRRKDYRQKRDDWSDAMALAASWGLTPEAVAYLSEVKAGPCERVLRLERDQDLARVAKVVLGAIEQAGNWPVHWPETGLLPGSARPTGLALSAEEFVRASAEDAAPGRPAERVEDRLLLTEDLANLYPSACVLAESDEIGSVHDEEAGRVLDLLRAAAEPPQCFSSAWAWYRRQRLALQAAERYLPLVQPRAWDRSVAERLIVAEGKDSDLQTAEGWLVGYATEAVRGEGEEAREAYALSVRLLAGLRERARSEARVLLARHLGETGAGQRAVGEAMRRALVHISAARHLAPRFADRLEWALAVEGVALWGCQS